MPGKNGFVKISLSSLPVNVYLIFLEIVNCCGVIKGSSLQSAERRSVATQKVVLLIPVPFGSTSGGSSPYYYPP